MSRSLPDNLEFAVSLDKVARTDGTATGTAVDTGRDHFQRMAEIDVGVWTDGTHTITFEDSPDNSTWTELVAAELDDPAGLLSGASIVIDAADEDAVIIKIGLLSVERYVRAIQVTASSSTGAILGVKILSGSKRHAGGQGQPMAVSGYQRVDPTI